MSQFRIRGDISTTELYLEREDEDDGVVLKAEVGGKVYDLMTIHPSGHIIVHSLRTTNLEDLGFHVANVEGDIGFPSLLDDENEQLFILERTRE